MDGELLDVLDLVLGQRDLIAVAIQWGEQRFAFLTFEHRVVADAGNRQIGHLGHTWCPGLADLVGVFE